MVSMPVCTRYAQAQVIAAELGFLVERGSRIYKVWRGTKLSIRTELAAIATSLKEVAVKINAALNEEVSKLEAEELKSPTPTPPPNPDPETEEDVLTILSPADAAIVLSICQKNEKPYQTAEIKSVEITSSDEYVEIQTKRGRHVVMKITYLNCWRKYHNLCSVDLGTWKAKKLRDRLAKIPKATAEDTAFYMRLHAVTGRRRADIIEAEKMNRRDRR